MAHQKEDWSQYHRNWAEGLDKLYPLPTFLLGGYVAAVGERSGMVVLALVLYVGLNVLVSKLAERLPKLGAMWYVRVGLGAPTTAWAIWAAGADAPGWFLAMLPVFGGVVGQSRTIRLTYQISAVLTAVLPCFLLGVPWAEMGGIALFLACAAWLSNGFFAMLFPTWVRAQQNEQIAQEQAQRAESAARELQAKNEVLELALATRQAFLATMSHEVRTPLNGVLGMAQLLESSPLNRDQANMVAMIRRSGRGLLQILNDLLDTSKLDAGKVELEHIAYDPQLCAQEVLDLMQGVAQGKELSLRLEVHNLPPAILGDPGRHRQVLLNLVGNAVKFTDEGWVALRLSWDGDMLEVQVEDTGIGISQEAMQRLFSPFEQAERGTTRRFGGTGLGLTISNRLVGLMQGEMKVDSVPMRGTCFSYRIPAEEAEAEVTQTHEDTTSDQPLMLHILLVDDNAVNRMVASRMLQQMGCEVITAEDGHEAIDAALSNVVDLVLMDCRMPVMDGLEATRRLREEGFSIPILALTAGVTAAEVQDCLDCGMDAVLAKPIDQQALRVALEEWGPTKAAA